MAVVSRAVGDRGGADQNAGGETAGGNRQWAIGNGVVGRTPLPIHHCPLPARIDVEPLADHPGRPRAILDGLLALQDKFGIRLANGEGTHTSELFPFPPKHSPAPLKGILKPRRDFLKTLKDSLKRPKDSLERRWRLST